MLSGLLVILAISGPLLPGAYSQAPDQKPAPPAAREVERELPAPLKRARRTLLNGDYSQALQQFQRYVEKHPDDSEGHFWVGTAQLELQEPAKAIQSYMKAVEINDRRGLDGAQVRVNLGNALLTLERTDEAITEYKRALKIDPYEPRAHFNLARALLKKDSAYHAAIAVSHLNIAGRLGLTLPEVWKYRAQAYAMTKRYEDARTQLSEYLKRLPDTAEAAEARRKVGDLISVLADPPTEKEGLVPLKKRRYKLSRDLNYAVTDVDEWRNMITLVTTDDKDPDGGLQDGINDGFFQMRIEDFQKQLSEGAGLPQK
jgi:tetratricopeptide (TPR) repeat protein